MLGLQQYRGGWYVAKKHLHDLREDLTQHHIVEYFNTEEKTTVICNINRLQKIVNPNGALCEPPSPPLPSPTHHSKSKEVRSRRALGMHCKVFWKNKKCYTQIFQLPKETSSCWNVAVHTAFTLSFPSHVWAPDMPSNTLICYSGWILGWCFLASLVPKSTSPPMRPHALFQCWAAFSEKTLQSISGGVALCRHESLL